MLIKKAVVETNVSPCVETGKPCETIRDGEPCLIKHSAQQLSVVKPTSKQESDGE